MRANIRDKSFVIILMNKFGQHDVREQVPVFAFLQCGAHKQQTCCTGVTTCSKWEWKETRFYMLKVGVERDKILQGQLAQQ
jgi:hypothetical protein